MFSEACLGLRKQGLFLKSNHFPLFNIYQIYGEQWLSVNRSPAQRAGAHFWKLVTYSIYIWSEPAFYQMVFHSVPAPVGRVWRCRILAVGPWVHDTISLGSSSIICTTGMSPALTGPVVDWSGAQKAQQWPAGASLSLSPTHDTPAFPTTHSITYLCLAFRDQKNASNGNVPEQANFDALLVAKSSTHVGIKSSNDIFSGRLRFRVTEEGYE